MVAQLMLVFVNYICMDHVPSTTELQTGLVDGAFSSQIPRLFRPDKTLYSNHNMLFWYTSTKWLVTYFLKNTLSVWCSLYMCACRGGVMVQRCRCYLVIMQTVFVFTLLSSAGWLTGWLAGGDKLV